jgi:Ca-activated chloride channel family protein
VKTIFIFLIFNFSLTAVAGDLQGVLRNNAGAKKFESKDASKALDDFARALVDLPFSGEVHYNIGNTFLKSREYEKALNEFRLSMEDAKGDSKNEREVRFRALFNSAVVQTELKKTDAALELYQKALELKPDSVETKTNIELLTQNGGGNGEGEGKDKDQKDKKDGKEDDKDKDQKQPKPGQKMENPHYKPKEFKSEELTKEDVKRIMEELKRQEEQIRARMNNDQAKDAPVGKDW